MPIIIAIIIWAIFNPGILDYDGMTYAYSAITGQGFQDYRPMAPMLAMRVLFLVTNSVAVWTLLLSLSISILSYKLIESLCIHFELSTKLIGILWLSIILITPLFLYMVYVENSSLLLIPLIACTTIIVQKKGEVKDISWFIFWLSIAPLIRDSAVLLFIPGAFLLYDLSNRFKKSLRYFFAIAPIILFLVVKGSIYSNIPHTTKHVASEFMFLDVVGAVKLDERIGYEVPYITNSFKRGWKEGHKFGAITRLSPYVVNNINMVFWGTPDERIAPAKRIPEIQEAWIQVVTHHPWTLVKVKLITFIQFFNPKENTDGWAWTGIAKYLVQINPNPFFTSIREKLIYNGSIKTRNPSISVLLRGGECVWFPISIILLGWSLWKRTEIWKWLILPISYVLSYGIVTVQIAHKYLYPATAVVQLIVIVWLAYVLKNILRKRR